MTSDAWITLAVVAAMIASLASGVVRVPWTAMVGSVVALVLLGVLEPEEAFAGLASPAVITIAALLVLARAVQDAGGVHLLVRTVLGPGHGDRRVLARLVAPVTVLSALLNNTPIVATLAPTVRRWALDHGRSPSKYLIPLSFAAILGGMVTTIGTSTNLVVSGIVASQLGVEEGFGFFEVTAVGLPAALIGGLLLVLLAPKVLPDRAAADGPGDPTSATPYEFHALVEPGGRAAGQTVAGAGLRNLAGVYLARIERSHTSIAPVAPDEVLREGDVLTFVGRVDQVRDVTGLPGLRSTEHEHATALPDTERYYEAVISPGSRLHGHTLKEVGFRAGYGAAVIAIRRQGERLDAKLGTVRLRAGDVLLLLSDRGFADRAVDGHDFALVSSAGEHREVSRRTVVATSAALLATVVLAATGTLPLVHAALLGVAVVAVAGGVTPSSAIHALDLEVLLLVGASLGLGTAVHGTGLADRAVTLLSSLGDPLGGLGALALLLLVAVLMTEVVSNQATAAVLAPVAIDLALEAGADPVAYAVAVAVVASASFLSPIGFQTNTLVYALGGYRYGDYWRLGLPLTLTVLVTTLTVVGLVW